MNIFHKVRLCQSQHTSEERVRFNTLRPVQNCGDFADNILKYIFIHENVWMLASLSQNNISQFGK